MALEALKIRLLMMLDEATHQPEDLHELQEELREKIAEFRAQGLRSLVSAELRGKGSFLVTKAIIFSRGLTSQAVVFVSFVSVLLLSAITNVSSNIDAINIFLI